MGKLKRAANQASRDAIETAMRAAGGNRTRAAAALGISRQHLYNLLRLLHCRVQKAQRGGLRA